jgi:hypothetical protein
MILKYVDLSSFGVISAISASNTSMSFPLLLKAILGSFLFAIALVHVIRAFAQLELNREVVKHCLLFVLYLGLALYSPGGIDRLLSMPREMVIAFAIALSIILLLKRGVQAIVEHLLDIFEGPTEFIFLKIEKMLPKHPEDIQIEIDNLNVEDFRTSAGHEAGHVLLYGVLDFVPTTLVASVSKKAHNRYNANYRMIGGQVSAKREVRSHQYRSFVEWDMLLCLAGQEGEKALLGQCSTGSQVDIEDWYVKAKIYLRSGFSRLIYFPSPESDWEERANRKSLELMQARQRKLLSIFFKENLHVLQEFSEALIQREKLKADDLKPVLKKVVRTPGIPSVLKEYSPHI